jgi:hypothetical protein
VPVSPGVANRSVEQEATGEGLASWND